MKNNFLLFTLYFLLPITLSAQWSQLGQDLNGEAIYDESGRAISMPDPITIAVGAEWNDDLVSNRGHVRVYRLSRGVWTQRGIDLNGEAYGDRSGTAISMPDDRTIAIGAKYNDGNGTQAGHVRIYRWSSTNRWTQRGQDIEGDTVRDYFGHAVSMPDLNTVAIGATQSDLSRSGPGYVRVMEWGGRGWVQKGQDILGGTGMGLTGYAVSMPDPNTVAFSGYTTNGTVRVYQWNGSAWVQKGQDIIGESAQDRFGEAISMPDSNTIAIGAKYNDAGQHSSYNSGHVRIFKWSGTTWAQIGGDLDGEASGDLFGTSVSMPDPYTVAVGGFANDGNGNASGHARVFRWIGTSWAQKGSDIDGMAAGDQSGWSVCMPDSNYVAIGAPFNSTTATFAGHARVFQFSTITALEEYQKLEQLSIYPNPTVGLLNITTPKPNGTRVQILDLSGKILRDLRLSSKSQEVDLSDLSEGLYFIRYDEVVEKLVVSR